MTEKFRALLVTKDGDRQSVGITELTGADLMEGDVTLAVEHSTVNYKDGLAITGKAPIIRKFPLIPGIDLAGRVLRSEDPRFQAGDRVVANGFGLGETHHGGYAEQARLKGDWLIRLPDNISTAQAMAIGTAGYTAMLCVLALEKEGIKPDNGDVLVTGAAGGVGSVAIALLDKLGYRVVASSRRAEQESDYLQGLGADEIIDARELSEAGNPLSKERWAGAIDSLGSRTLANVLSQIKYDGAVAACGLAQGSDLPATVLPFILRDITLAGVNSVLTPREKREEAWGRLATNLDPAKLSSMTSRARLEDVPFLATEILAGKTRGRVVIDL
ncbi:MAG: MDR family oxidoreductase [Methyloceanibacter sp.]|uniref:acrylyl-CoA reductase (NADPH) n=1 Tax=Methyloceanibacter sp. TaxID=1965321 RepID=UPI003D6D1075